MPFPVNYSHKNTIKRLLVSTTKRIIISNGNLDIFFLRNRHTRILILRPHLLGSGLASPAVASSPPAKAWAYGKIRIRRATNQ